MARILSRDRDKDPFNDGEAERRFLQSKPTCFIIIGKPGSGKTTLAKKLAKTWKCELVDGTVPLQQAMELSTELGLKAQSILLRGEAIPEELASQLLEEKISSPEVAHHGYVLDGFPSLCEDWISMKEQLELIKNWKYKPDFIINLKIPDKDLEERRINQLVDPMTNKMYTKDVYDPVKPANDDKQDLKDGEKDDELGDEDELSDGGEEEEEEDDDEDELEFNDVEDGEGFPQEILSRLVTRPEDLPENVKSGIKRYKELILRMIEDYMADHDQQKLIEVDANIPPKAIFKAVTTKLSTFAINHALTTLPLQGDEDSEEISNDADTDDLLRSLASAGIIAPKFRWRRSRWGRLCPVELYDGNIVPGQAKHAVSFLDKIYCLSSSEALAKFVRNPRPFLSEPNPCPPCKLCIIGPPCSGKTTLAKSIAQRYQAQYLDVDVLIVSKKDIAKQKLLEEVREEAIEAAIAKVTVAIQIEKEEEEERLASEAEAKRVEEEIEKKKQEDEEPNDAGEEDDSSEEQEDEMNKEKNENEISKEIEEIKEDQPIIDKNHPEVVKLVKEAMAEAEGRDPDISAEEYVDVVEEAIQARCKELEEARGKGQRLGCYVLDNFPFTREQFTLMIERGLVPDTFIFLKDESENGLYLAKRWAKLHRVSKSFKDITEEQEEGGGEEKEEGEEDKKEEVGKKALNKDNKSGGGTSKDLGNYQALRTTFENNSQQLIAIVKGTNNLEPIMINCENDMDSMTDEAIKSIEGAFSYYPWEYTGMDEDEEEEDAEDDDEVDEEEDADVFNRDLRRKLFGDTKHYCAVMLKENGVLWPGLPECAAKYRERVYFFVNNECRRQFLDDPTQYLPIDRPLKPPPIRLFIIGPKGAGKTLHARYLAEKLGIFHINFQERLQELIIAKTKKRVGPDYEDDDENTEENPDVGQPNASDGEKNRGEKQGSEGEGVKEEVEEIKLTEEEESIHANLTEGEHLQRETLEKILNPWWNEEPFKSRGFILEGFPRSEDETRLLSVCGLFADAAILLAVEDTEIIKRLLPTKLDKWRFKRDKRLAEKEKQKEIALKAKEELRAKRKEEFLLEIANRKAEKKARLEARENGDSGAEEGDDDEDDEEETEEVDVDALLDAEFEEDEEFDEEEEETEAEASERLKMEMIDRYEDETSKLAIVQEILEEILIPRVEVDGGRKPRIVRYSLEGSIKPIVDYREGLFDRCFSITPMIAQRMLVQGYKFPSRFGKWCPVKLLDGDVIHPYTASGVSSYPVVYRQFIYYLSSEKARMLFTSCPTKYLKQPSPKPVVPIRMAIIGPPKSGKTTLANRFSLEYGTVRLSIGEVLRRLLTTQPNTELVKQINHHLRSGCTVPDDLAVQALEIVLMDAHCQVGGYILDGFPVTKRQLDLMTDRSIMPVKVLELRVDDDEVFKRATLDRRSPSRTFPVHDSHTIISIRLASWKREVDAVREWYQNVQRNWISLDGERSKWMVWNNALKEAKRSVKHIQTYLLRISEGKAASIANMCVTPKEFSERLGDFGQYCPVSLADYGQLVDCSENPSLAFAAEFRGRYYKMESPKELENFLDNPTKYVPPLAPRLLPPVEMLPHRRNALEMKARFPCQIELQGYCPVTFLDGKKRYEFIVPGDPELIVEYREAFYAFESETKLDMFMRKPEMYHGLTLPRKLPPRSAPLAIHHLPMLGFLEQTASAEITKALTSVGCFKPKYPFLSARRSALLYVAYHLKAFNPKGSEYVRGKYKQKLKKFEERCELITYLGNNMTLRYKDPRERPFDFDRKMKNFLELKILRPTFA